jgi:predicted RNase H-like nuclease (RuvC/YqgF family)
MATNPVDGICEEGINKTNYSDNESSDDSDTDLLMKFVPKRNDKIQKFDTTVYSFKLNIKISKLRSELARCEERLRYLQLDHNNKNIENEEYKERIKKHNELLRRTIERNNFLEQELKKKKHPSFIVVFCVSIIVNFLFHLL